MHYSDSERKELANIWLNKKEKYQWGDYHWLNNLCTAKFYEMSEYKWESGKALADYPLTSIFQAIEILKYFQEQPEFVKTSEWRRRNANIHKNHPGREKALDLSSGIREYITHKYGLTQGLNTLVNIFFSILLDNKYTGPCDPELLEKLKSDRRFESD